jgi:hypothetical protein
MTEKEEGPARQGAAWGKSDEGGRRKFDRWRAQRQDVAAQTCHHPVQEDAAPTLCRDEPTESNSSGPNRDQDESPAAEGQTEVRPGNIDVNKMRKDDMLRFAADNNINIPGLEQRPIPLMKKALTAYLRANDVPEGGWKLPEIARSQLEEQA